MLIIGVTGGIGSGKSTVSGILEELGLKIIDADKVSREIVKRPSKALDELVRCFGGIILDETGALNRSKLSEIVFNDIDKLNLLNKITHKYIIEELLKRVEAERQKTEVKAIVIDAPIPVKHGFLDVVDEVWSIIADEEVRALRVMQRSGLSYEQAYERISSQKSNKQYLEIADEVIFNNGEISELREKVLDLCKSKGIG